MRWYGVFWIPGSARIILFIRNPSMPTVAFTFSRQGEAFKVDLDQGHYVCGRHPSCDVVFPATWLIASSRHMEICIDESYVVTIRDGVNGTKSTNGTIVNQHYLEPSTWQRISSTDEVQIGGNPSEAIQIRLEGCTDATVLLSQVDARYQTDSTVLLSSLPTSQDPITSIVDDQDAWDCIGNELTIGRSPTCDVRLDGQSVSRIHAIIKRNGNHFWVLDRSSNGIFVNGRPVGNSQRLHDGDEIKISTVTFHWRKPSLFRSSLGTSYRIDVRNLGLPGRLDGVNLSIEPGQFVAFVGGSGAGKSSLLTTIIGHNQNYTGNALINGREIRDSYESIKHDIGYVPQDDIIHTSLTVEEVLMYSARIKLPDAERHRTSVDRILDLLDIAHRRKSMVSALSGGQRKRVSIGVELIADPRILLLDEPTSGLDPGLDRKMMELLRSIADSGKTVAVVTHATTNVMLCDQVVFLARGGKLCFAGPPRDCLRYFDVPDDFPAVYTKLDKADAEIDYISMQFRERQLAKLPPTPRSLPGGKQKLSIGRMYNNPGSRFRRIIRQLRPTFERELTLIRRDHYTLLLNLFTAPVAIALCAFASENTSIFLPKVAADSSINYFNDSLSVILSISCAAAWVGLSSQLQSIVKERHIFFRERSFNLTPESYFVSKLVAMLSLALVQSGLMALALHAFFKAPKNSLGHWSLSFGFIMFLTIIALGAQGLMVSSLVRNNQQASSAAPILLLPQLVFSGVSFKLSDRIDWMYSIIASRWSVRAAGSVSNITSLIPSPLKERFVSEIDVYKHSWTNVNLSIKVLLVQVIFFLTLCFLSITLVNRKT